MHSLEKRTGKYTTKHNGSISYTTVNPVMLAPKIISVFDRTHILAAYKFSEILIASYKFTKKLPSYYFSI